MGKKADETDWINELFKHCNNARETQHILVEFIWVFSNESTFINHDQTERSTEKPSLIVLSEL